MASAITSAYQYVDNQIRSLPILDSRRDSTWEKVKKIFTLAMMTLYANMKAPSIADLCITAGVTWVIGKAADSMGRSSIRDYSKLIAAGSLFSVAFRVARSAWPLLFQAATGGGLGAAEFGAMWVAYWEALLAMQLGMAALRNSEATSSEATSSEGPSKLEKLTGPSPDEDFPAFCKTRGLFLNQEVSSELGSILRGIRIRRAHFEGLSQISDSEWELLQECGAAGEFISTAERFRKDPDPFSRGIVLHGGPGIGKTHVARLIGAYLGVQGDQLKIASGSGLLSKYSGQTEKNIQQLFQPALEVWEREGNRAPLHVIIFDEFDSICIDRDSLSQDHSHRAGYVNEFLRLLDGMGSPKNVFFIGITNRLEHLDPAIIRSGRLLPVAMALPDAGTRQEQIERLLEERGLQEQDITDLVGATEGLSGAEIRQICQSCVEQRDQRVLAKGLECLGRIREETLEWSSADWSVGGASSKESMAYLMRQIEQLKANKGNASRSKMVDPVGVGRSESSPLLKGVGFFPGPVGGVDQRQTPL